MSKCRRLDRLIAPLLGALALSACAGTYTGPVEVTRFVADNPAGLGTGPIRLEFVNPDLKETTRNAFAAAIAQELSNQGYELMVFTAPDEEANSAQIASIDTARSPIASASNGRGPVSVGAGGSAGSFGSGVGLGIGINLGGGNSGPQVLTELSVRISRSDGETLWEGRAQQPVAVKSDYAEVNASAQALAQALFRDFPGGNGETVIVNVRDLQEAP